MLQAMLVVPNRLLHSMAGIQASQGQRCLLFQFCSAVGTDNCFPDNLWAKWNLFFMCNKVASGVQFAF